MQFWKFSTDMLQRDGVAKACLLLQDRYGMDINLLMFCTWAARLCQMLDDESFKPLVQLSWQWHAQTVAPLRSLRRELKNSQLDGLGSDELNAFRVKVIDLELESERLQQHAIEQLARFQTSEAFSAPARTAFDHNVQLYFRLAMIEVDTGADSALQTVRNALCGAAA